MSELTIPSLKNSFKTQNLTEKDHLNYDELYIVISKLNASAFDEQTYEEIWDQCKLNSKGEARISDFMDYLIKAEELLLQKQHENGYNIHKRQIQAKGKVMDFSEQKAYNDEMNELYAERQAVKNSLSIIRKPFTIQPENILQELLILPQGIQQPQHQQQKNAIRQDDVVNQLFEYDSKETPAALSTIFYITSFLLFLTWIDSFFICQFLNLIAYTCILSQFSFQIISKKLIKFNLLMLCYCSIFDIVWLILQTDKLWYLPSNFQLASMTSSYLKFSIVIMIFCLCLRVALMYYYLSQYHLDEFQVYTVRLLGRDLNIQREAEPLNPNRHALSHFLQPYFNKPISQDDQIQ